MTRARAAALALLAVAGGGCGGRGGAHGPAAAPRPAPGPTRVVIEDSTRHDADDDVELVSTRGHLDPADVERALAPRTAALADCYASRLDHRRWLGGQVSLAWEVRASGATARVALAESDLGAWPVEKCLLAIARDVRFPAPRGGDTEVSIPLDFSAKGRPDAWGEERSRDAIGAAQLAGLARCAADAGPHGAPTGDVLVTVYVGPHGRALSAGFASAAGFAEAWGDCAERQVLAWRLPDPRGHVVKLSARFAAR